MKEELKREIEDNYQSESFYNVYKTSTGLYLEEALCQKYNIGIQNETKIIKDNNCCLINEKDLETISQITKQDSIRLVPNFVTIFDLQLVLSFTAYVDTNHDRKIYISDSTCIKYNITPISKRMINGATFCNVKEEDLTRIEKQSANEKIKLKRNYVEIDLPDEIKPAEYLFILYVDSETNKHYIRRDNYEAFKKADIDIEGNPKIIDGKNCYSITKNQLKEVENKMNYRGVEQLLKPTANIYPLEKTLPRDEDIGTIVKKIYSIKERVSLFQQAKTYDDEKVKDDIHPYIERIEKDIIKPVLGDNDIIKPFIEILDEESLIIYRDKKTNQLYIPTDKDQATTIIMHKPCRKTDFNEIRNLNKRIVIASVYTIKKEELDIIICNNNGQLFISHDALATLGFYIENPHRIMVNKEIYEEIAQEDLDLIKDLDPDNYHINLIMKQIAPKKG